MYIDQQTLIWIGVGFVAAVLVWQLRQLFVVLLLFALLIGGYAVWKGVVPKDCGQDPTQCVSDVAAVLPALIADDIRCLSDETCRCRWFGSCKAGDDGAGEDGVPKPAGAKRDLSVNDARSGATERIGGAKTVTVLAAVKNLGPAISTPVRIEVLVDFSRVGGGYVGRSKTFPSGVAAAGFLRHEFALTAKSYHAVDPFEIPPGEYPAAVRVYAAEGRAAPATRPDIFNAMRDDDGALVERRDADLSNNVRRFTLTLR